ncbi:MAG TPA: AAA family ATPase [Xanthobacteraceae bacterium]|nr:AAA family ATPase [Xanthobacteraceae bacterium]
MTRPNGPDNDPRALLDARIARHGGAATYVHEAMQARDWVDVLREWEPPAHDTAPRPVRFMWDGLIARGLVGVLVAAGGTGKTVLLLSLFVCGALGRKFLGLDVARGSYVLLSNDDPQDDLDQALVRIENAMNLTDAERATVRRHVCAFSLQAWKGEKTFSMTVDGTPQPTELATLVVGALTRFDDLQCIAFDTLRQFSGAASTDERAMKIAIDGGRDIAARLGCAVVFAHHTGKANFRDNIVDQYCGTGSAVIADNSRFVLLLQATEWKEIEADVKRTGQEEGDALKLLSTRGSLLVRAGPPLYLYRDDFLVRPIAGALRTIEQVEDERDCKILRAVREGAANKSQVFAVVRGRKVATLERVEALIARGFLENGSRNGSRSLMLTSKGAKLLMPF